MRLRRRGTMKIVAKATKAGAADAVECVERCIARVLGGGAASASVARVFPDVTSGNRARLLVVDLPDDTGHEQVAVLLEQLRDESLFEYVEEPAPKQPSGDGC